MADVLLKNNLRLLLKKYCIGAKVREEMKILKILR